MALLFPRFVEEEDNRTLMEDVTEEELKEVLHSFQKDKSPGPDGWSMDFFEGLFDLIGKDILKVVEESRRNGYIHAPLNATVIAPIPKKDDPRSLEDFKPISLCNCIYKVIAKIISRRLKVFLSKSISQEQFGFLEGRQIHEAIGVAQEALHSIKTQKLKGAVLKIDLSKYFDIVSWLYLRILLTHLGFELAFTNWIISYISTVSFVVLIKERLSLVPIHFNLAQLFTANRSSIK
jgi:hypothetical protein